MRCFKYKSYEDYLYHVKQLMKSGLSWYHSTSEEEYAPYYYEYDDFILFVDEGAEFGELSYGRPDWVDKGVEIELYSRKNSNVYNY